VNVPEVTEYAKTLPSVVRAEHNLYTCSEAGLTAIRNSIKQDSLNRVVVASCTPRTHEPLFKAACQEAGLNPYLFEMANIREHDSWVHPHEHQKATRKAKDVVRMAVAKAALLEPQIEPEVEVEGSSLVIGAGVSGLSAALSMANQGFKVCLIEKEKQPGGTTKHLYKLYPTLANASEVVEPLIDAVKSHKNIELMTSTTLKDVSGYIGNFNPILTGPEGDRELKVGTIIVAAGSSSYTPPKGSYGYGVLDHVITQNELDTKLRKGEIGKPERIVMIQCVGARKGEIRPSELEAFPKSDTAELLRRILKARKEEGWPYCSRICCMNAIKNAILIKEKSPKTDVVLLFGDIRVYKEYEDFYRKARDLEVRFIRHLEEAMPEITQTSGQNLQVKAYAALSGMEVTFPAEWVVLSTPLVPSKDEITLAKMLKIPIATDGFMMEAHLKLRPVDTNVDGVFIAGTVSGPKDVSESIISGQAAAARAAILMGNGKVKTEAITAVTDESLCIGCGLCEEICPYGAPKIEDGKSRIREILCRGCGSCAAECPKQAITMRRYRDDQVLAQVKSLLFADVPSEARGLMAEGISEEEKRTAEGFEPLIVAYCCNWCSYAGADLAGTSRFEYPANIRIVRVMCTGRIDPTLALEALGAGADGVLIAGCHPGDCHYQKGNYMMEKRFEYIKKAAGRMGIEPERLRLEWISASEGGKWAALVREMTEQIRRLGPNPLRLGRVSRKTEATIDAFKAQRLRWVVGRSQIKVEIQEDKYRQTVDSIMQIEIERHMITLALKEKGGLTTEELAQTTGLKPDKVLQHLIALRKTGEISETGEKDGQYMYQLV
jgi:heterodisulfide reductase subunit A2